MTKVQRGGVAYGCILVALSIAVVLLMGAGVFGPREEKTASPTPAPKVGSPNRKVRWEYYVSPTGRCYELVALDVNASVYAAGSVIPCEEMR